jgi:trans-aconitate 2-methyltransferase
LNWDPGIYLRFADHRLRPGFELMARIEHPNPRSVVDLGCGTGELTTALADRWPHAEVCGVDASEEMLARAAARGSRAIWLHSDIRTWEPRQPVDVVFSNAALHWLVDHDALFGRLGALVAPGGVLAVQMPANWDQPTHRVPAIILEEPGWPEQARLALMRDRVATPAHYRAMLRHRFTAIDMWSTTYHQVLTGRDPVLTWVEGSVLRPVLAALEPDARERFRDRCAEEYAAAYPANENGETVLEFTRLFIVAR